MTFGDDRTKVVIDSPDPIFDEFEDDDDDIFSAIGEQFDVDFEIGDPFLELKYGQPNVAVDTSARYVTHEVIGDTTVRQKLGEDPDTISINGICTAEEANKIDKLTEFPYVELVSNRWSGFAQIASANTSPHSEGGTQDKDEEWLHTFSIELAEVTDI